jgi:hypothetical protein
VSELSWWWSPHPDREATEDWSEEVPVVRYETEDEVLRIGRRRDHADPADQGG